MFHLHQIDPIALQLGPVAIHWYGLMYLLAFGAAWWLGRARLRAGRFSVSEQAFGDLMFYGMLGVVLGGRIGYIMFYGYQQVLADPLSALRVWEGGMSFHGGLLGVIVAMWWWSRAQGKPLWDTLDFVAPLVPTGLLFGRIGNYIGGELWGRTTDVAWAVIFPSGLDRAYAHEELQRLHAEGALDAFARHPSQLYEAFLEGLVLFVVVWWFAAKPRRRYAVSGLFALGYGVFRFAVEFVREPDAHIGYLAVGWFTMGMLLSLPMVVLGLLLLGWSRRASSPRVA
jgi:phosphatidylglycerol:prolipoprotein diacylglycerol transferase